MQLFKFCTSFWIGSRKAMYQFTILCWFSNLFSPQCPASPQGPLPKLIFLQKWMKKMTRWIKKVLRLSGTCVVMMETTRAHLQNCRDHHIDEYRQFTSKFYLSKLLLPRSTYSTTTRSSCQYIFLVTGHLGYVNMNFLRLGIERSLDASKTISIMQTSFTTFFYVRIIWWHINIQHYQCQ